MLFDVSRGWAWTQAIVGVPARELIVICSDFAVAVIERLIAPWQRPATCAASSARM